MTVQEKAGMAFALGFLVKRFVPSRVARKLTPIINMVLMSGVGVAQGEDFLPAVVDGAAASAIATGVHSSGKNASEAARILRR